MRFAASLQDMRTVVLLHRQLSMEKSRSRPWIPLLTRRKVRHPAWRRGWHGYVRWPANRVVRVAVLLAATGVLAYASRSTHLLIIVAGATLFVAALDFIEPFAAELDHPTALLTYGVSIRSVLLRNLAAPVAALVGVSLIGAGALAAATDHFTVVVFACALSASLAALAGSALNVALGPPPASQLEMLLLMPDIYGLILLVRQGLPPALGHRRTGADRGRHDRRCRARDHRRGRARVGIDRCPLVRGLTGSLTTMAHQDRPESLLFVDHLTKNYDGHGAVHDLNLRLGFGSLVALVGHNGAGKSTLLGSIAGLIEPSDGRVFINGHEAGTLPARAELAYAADNPVLYDDLSVWEHLEYVAALHGVDDWQTPGRELVEAFGLTSRAGDLPSKFSRGMRQKAALAVALVRPASLIIIDEPFVGLDMPRPVLPHRCVGQARALGHDDHRRHASIHVPVARRLVRDVAGRSDALRRPAQRRDSRHASARGVAPAARSRRRPVTGMSCVFGSDERAAAFPAHE